MKLKDYLFIDNESGEQFFVECESLNKAYVILEMSGFQSNEVEYLEEYSVEEAEILGYDTY